MSVFGLWLTPLTLRLVPSRFTINFLRGNDIAFHINPRFNDGGKQVVVRNHKVGERWGLEERDLKGSFPFAAGSPFEVRKQELDENVIMKYLPVFVGPHRTGERSPLLRLNLPIIFKNCIYSKNTNTKQE